MKMKTIAKNRKSLIAEIVENATNIKGYNQQKGDMEECSSLSYYIQNMALIKSSRMYVSEDGSGSISIHSNSFCKFQLPESTLKKIFK